VVALNPIRDPNDDLSPKLTPHLTRSHFNKTELPMILHLAENHKIMARFGLKGTLKII